MSSRTSKLAGPHDARVSVIVENGPYRGVSRTEIVRRVYAMIDALQLKDVEVSIVLTDPKRIHELNKVYRHKDRPTDVLAFAMREGDFAGLAGGVLGDVIVSVEVARKQAAERSVTVLEEVTMLTAHGLLHLLGWDHETPLKDRRMRAETDRLCRAATSVAADGGRTDGRRGPKRQLSTAAGKARAVRQTGVVKKASPAAPGGLGMRSKATAKRALSRKGVTRSTRQEGGKVEAPQRVKTRRSRKR